MTKPHEVIPRVTGQRLTRLEKDWPEKRNECNDWERKFMADMLCRWRIYGYMISLSARQINMITEIHDRLYDV